MKPKTMQWGRAGALVLAGIGTTIALTMAQTRPGPILSLTATTDNVSNARESIKIDVLRWSTDAERDELLAAWNKAAAPPARAEGAGKQGKQGGKQAGKEGAGKEGAGKGAPPPRVTPEKALAQAIEKAPTVGYLWSSEIAGYALHCALRQMEPDGSETIRLITERRLGAWNDLWKPVGAASGSDYEFSVVELHLNGKGEGEGKASLTGKVAVDGAAKTIGLENYSALPVVFKNVKRRTAS